MKLLLGLFLIVSFGTFAQTQTYELPEYISGSLFYTGSSASHEKTSGAFSGYVSATIGTYNYITAGYDNVDITHPEWDYSQKMWLAGGGLSLYPLYIKAHYGRINGKFSAPDFDLYHNDKTTLYNADLLYYTNFLVFRGSFVYEKITENINLQVRQYGLGFERYLGQYFYASLFGYLSDLSDDRELKSLKTKVTWIPSLSFNLSLETFFGKRAFFFHNDLLTIFNQGVNQESLYSLRAEYYLSPYWLVIANFQYTDFEDHAARYYVAGLKYTLLY